MTTKEKQARLDEIATKKRPWFAPEFNVIDSDCIEWLIRELRDSWAREKIFREALYKVENCLDDDVLDPFAVDYIARAISDADKIGGDGE